MTKFTICVNCTECHVVNKHDPPWRWLCRRHPMAPNYLYVTNRAWDGWPPYVACKDINKGACPDFRQRQDEENPK